MEEMKLAKKMHLVYCADHNRCEWHNEEVINMAKVKSFNIQAFNKAIVALVMAVIGVVNLVWGFPLVDETVVTTVVTVLTPVLVYLIPNRK